MGSHLKLVTEVSKYLVTDVPHRMRARRASEGRAWQEWVKWVARVREHRSRCAALEAKVRRLRAARAERALLLVASQHLAAGRCVRVRVFAGVQASQHFLREMACVCRHRNTCV